MSASGSWVLTDDHNVGDLAGLQRAQLVFEIEEHRRIPRERRDDLLGRQDGTERPHLSHEIEPRRAIREVVPDFRTGC